MDSEQVKNRELVIKVNYGATLRRFTVSVKENDSIELDMAGLRAKIMNLFKLAPDADVSLTYEDEDEDVVTLVDDADLWDAVKQRLSPLRITVTQNSVNAGNSGKRIPTYTPVMRSPRGSPRNPYAPTSATYPMAPPQPSNFTTTSVSSHMGPAVPTPPRTSSGSPMLSPVGPLLPSNDQPSKASSSTTATIPEQSLAKLCRDLASAVSSAAPNHDTVSKLAHDVAAKALSASPIIEALSKLAISNLVPSSESQGETISKKQQDSSQQPQVSPNANYGDAPSNFVNSTKSASISDPGSAFVPPQPIVSPVLPVCPQNYRGAFLPQQPIVSPVQPVGVQNYRDAFLPQHPIVAPQNNVSVNGQVGQSAPLHLPSGMCPRNNYMSSDNMGRIFHQGVQCDGCGVHPITGPRYKSKVKEDYDLCSVCFADMGNATDYNKLDRPMHYRPHRLRKFLRPHVRHIPPLGVRLNSMRSNMRSVNQQNHDSHFVEDVNVLDGTLMAPKTPFTKIWRMHNSGTVAWPRGTQLVWIAGDKLTNIPFLELELPSGGCLPGMDINVAVDFVAPELPGQYVSYWRMALPSGEKFGQCVWVLIQVDVSQTNSPSESVRNLNLNLPPLSGESQDLIIDVNVEPVGASDPFSHSNIAVELVRPDDVDVSIVEDSLSSLPVEVPVPFVESSPSAPSPVEDVEKFPSQASDGNTLEQSLLKELEEMGFKEIDLNKEVLRVNEYDLDRSLDDLCGYAEWDPMLEELQEMGFEDKETNRKLLIKNGGSIKRVVMDLIAAEKA